MCFLATKLGGVAVQYYHENLGSESVNGSKGNEVSVTDGYCRIIFGQIELYMVGAQGKPNITRLSSIVFMIKMSKTNKDKKARGDTFRKWKVSIAIIPK